MNKLLIFTDLDGTFLDHFDYCFKQALPALEKIRLHKIPLIINSSKTYAEIKNLRTQMHNYWAFIVENGAAIFLPGGQLFGENEGFEEVILGTSYTDILSIIHQLRAQQNLAFKGFYDYSIQQLMLETNLTELQASQAKQRLASEPLTWLDDQKKLIEFEQALTQQGLRLIKGGRFYHVMGQNDKGLAMAWLLNRFKQQHINPTTIALGDSENDQKMLELADYAGVIRQQDGSYLKLDKNLEQVFFSKNPAPLGWKEAIDHLFDRLEIGEISE